MESIVRIRVIVMMTTSVYIPGALKIQHCRLAAAAILPPASA